MPDICHLSERPYTLKQNKTTLNQPFLFSETYWFSKILFFFFLVRERTFCKLEGSNQNTPDRKKFSRQEERFVQDYYTGMACLEFQGHSKQQDGITRDKVDGHVIKTRGRRAVRSVPGSQQAAPLSSLEVNRMLLSHICWIWKARLSRGFRANVWMGQCRHHRNTQSAHADSSCKQAQLKMCCGEEFLYFLISS